MRFSRRSGVGGVFAQDDVVSPRTNHSGDFLLKRTLAIAPIRTQVDRQFRKTILRGSEAQVVLEMADAITLEIPVEICRVDG